jgi:hypothetical protein
MAGLKKLFNADSNKKIDKGYQQALAEISKTQSALTSGLRDTTKYYNQIEQLGNLLSNGKSTNLLQKAGIPKAISIFNKYQSDIFGKISQAKSGIEGVKRFTGLIKEKVVKKKGGDEAWFNQSDPNYKDTNNRNKGLENNKSKPSSETKQISTEFSDKEKEEIKTINDRIKFLQNLRDSGKNVDGSELSTNDKRGIGTEILVLDSELSSLISKARNNQNKPPVNKDGANPSNSAPPILISPPIHTPDNTITNQTEWIDIQNGLNDKIFKGWASNGKSMPTPTMNQPFWKRDINLKRNIRELPGSFKFYIEKLHGYDTQGNPYVANKIDDKADALKYQNRMVFPIFLDAWSDAFTANWNTIDLIGKSEPIRVYNNTTRQLSIEFFVLADFSAEIMLAGIQELQDFSTKNYPQTSEYGKQQQNIALSSTNKSKAEYDATKDLSLTTKQIVGSSMSLSEQKQAYLQLKAYTEQFTNWGHGSNNIADNFQNGTYGFTPSATTSTPEMLWNRLTFLAQCCYPYYRQDGKLKENPVVKLRLGDFFDVVCCITSLSINDMEMGWDLNYSNIGVIPMGAKISLSLDIIHQQTPSSTYSRFYHRKDYDKYDNPYDYIPATLKNSISKDEVLDKLLTDADFRKKILGDEINISTTGGQIATTGPTKVTEDGENFTSTDTMWPETVLYDIPNSAKGSNTSKDENQSNIQMYAENVSKLSDKMTGFNISSAKDIVSKNKVAEVLNISKKLLTAKNKLKNFKKIDDEVTENINKVANEFKPLVKKAFDIKNSGFAGLI